MEITETEPICKKLNVKYLQISWQIVEIYDSLLCFVLIPASFPVIKIMKLFFYIG